MANPFTRKPIQDGAPFCNRVQELAELAEFARSREKESVVLSGPRRYGKTSLVRRLQKNLREEGFITINVDFYAVDSVDSIARRLAKSVYSELHRKESLLTKGRRWLDVLSAFRPVIRPAADGTVEISVDRAQESLQGVGLLEKVLEDLGRFLEQGQEEVHIVFDEFQEIVNLKEPSLEALLRTHIQFHKAAYVFVGSRRKILLTMFEDRKRPFWGSGHIYTLHPMPEADLATYMQRLSADEGKPFEDDAVKHVAELAQGYVYYAQSLAFYAFMHARGKITVEDVRNAYEDILSREEALFEAMVSGATPAQLKVLKALAERPEKEMTSATFSGRLGLAASTVAYARRQLEDLDLIEKGKKDKAWKIVDPFFAEWLRRLE